MVTVVIFLTLSTLVFLWINPLAETGDAKDKSRIQHVNILAAAIKDYALDHNGALPVLGEIATSTKQVLCATQGGSDVTCDTDTALCLQIAVADFYSDYLPELPVDPDKSNDQDTGYYLQKDTDTGQLIVGSCETYGSTAITKMPGLFVSCDAYAGGYCWKISDTAGQDCNAVCNANSLICIDNVTYGPDADCALNLAFGGSSACNISCAASDSSGGLVANHNSTNDCYYRTVGMDCDASLSNYLNICPCQ